MGTFGRIESGRVIDGRKLTFTLSCDLVLCFQLSSTVCIFIVIYFRGNRLQDFFPHFLVYDYYPTVSSKGREVDVVCTGPRF